MQPLSWQTGDRYRTEDGTVMRIDSQIPRDRMGPAWIICRDEGNRSHVFHRDRSRAMRCWDCTHGDLMHRISGSVGA